MRKRRTSGLLSLMIMALLMLNLAGCSQSTSTQTKQNSATPTSQTTETKRTITDMGGRTVTVPSNIKTAYAISPVGSIMLYALCPDKMVGWNYDLRPSERKYILPKYQSLPNIGGWYATNTGNPEEILKIHPDVIIDMGDLNKAEAANADKIQEQLGIPVVLVDAPVLKMDKACEFMGDLLGEKVKGQELADYCRNTLADVTAKEAKIPQDKRISVYYAEGAKGLQSEPDGSTHIEALGVVGGLNVAKVSLGGKAGLSPVSLEQVLAWNPEVIIAWGEEQGGFYKGILSDPSWKGIKAVQRNRVYQIPDGPFCWFDRPPSINRIIGFKWLGNLLYPDVFDYNMVAEVKDFFTKFYHYNLTDEEAKTLLAQIKPTE